MPLHPIPPVWDAACRVLILGSFPSVRSRESGFFYGHPRNRFWRVLAAVYGAPEPVSVGEKTAFLLSRHIALWDVIASCDITGSADGSIRNVTPNDLAPLFSGAPIRHIFTNGSAASSLYRKYMVPAGAAPAEPLPSTSPANAAWSFARLCEAWAVVRRAEEGSLDNA